MSTPGETISGLILSGSAGVQGVGPRVDQIVIGNGGSRKSEAFTDPVVNIWYALIE